MLGIGEIDWGTNYLLLFILILPFFISLVFLKKRISDKSNMVKAAIWTILCGLPILIYIVNQVKLQNEKEKWFVGTYSLDKYPNCANCKLILSWDNTYVIMNSNAELENGDWRYVAQSVYANVELNTQGKLGIGKYQYNKFEPGYPE